MILLSIAVICAAAYGASWALAESTTAVEKATVIETESRNAKNLKLLIGQLDHYREQTWPRRRQFESSAAYEKRIRSNNDTLFRFLANRYKLVTSPDDVSLDWQNAVVRLSVTFPILVRRRRGGTNDSTELKVSAAVDPDTARIVKTFPQQVVLKVTFRFSQDRSIVIDKLTAEINGKEFHRE